MEESTFVIIVLAFEGLLLVVTSYRSRQQLKLRFFSECSY